MKHVQMVSYNHVEVDGSVVGDFHRAAVRFPEDDRAFSLAFESYLRSVVDPLQEEINHLRDRLSVANAANVNLVIALEKLKAKNELQPPSDLPGEASASDVSR